MKIIEYVICPHCDKDKFQKFKSVICCVNCNKKFTLNKNNQIIFEEVYKPESPNEKSLSLNLKNKTSFSWRELNFIKTKNWLKNIDTNAFCLDLGCGPMTNKKLFFNHYKTIFMDGAKFDTVNIVCNFEKKIPLKSNSIDCVLLSNVLEHIFYPEKLLKEINRILKKDGKCLILVPFFIKLHQEPYDYHRYTKHSLSKMLELSNFNNFKIEEMGSHSNILVNLLKLDRKLNFNKNIIIKFIIILLQKLIFRLILLQKKLTGEIVSKITPQGYAIEITK